jgi:putative addiction module component (TIGR02574 family)
VSTEEILAAALALPEADRRILLDRIAESLPEEFDAEYEAELDRREAEIEADPSRLIPGEIVFAELHAKLAKVRAAG